MGLYLPTGEKIKPITPNQYEGADFIMRGAGVRSEDSCVINMAPLLDFQIQGFHIGEGYFLYKTSLDEPYMDILIEREVEGKKYPIYKITFVLNIFNSKHEDNYMIRKGFADIPLLLSTDIINVKTNVELSYFEFYGTFQPVVHTIDVF